LWVPPESSDALLYFYAMPPSYVYLSENDWDARIREALRLAAPCRLCPRKCGVDRAKGETGFCKAPDRIVVSSAFAHHGEEPPISGSGGSGTVFFSYCTLKCCFCQNYQLSHEAEGRPMPPSGLARKCLDLQEQGCHNINLVTPSHFLPWLLMALKEAAGAGLSVPIVHNNGGYELTEPLELLRGVVDVYLPDMKYGRPEEAMRYSRAPDYVDVNQAAVKAMFRQTGALAVDKNGIARRGMCIRHLVLPGGFAHSGDILEFLLKTFDPHDLTISLMAQYRPLYHACDFPEIAKTPTPAEYEPVKRKFEESGIGGYFQELAELDTRFCIDFTKRKSEPLRGA
jgi:putative pyruvate formate lyase activating enzyme